MHNRRQERLQEQLPGLRHGRQHLGVEQRDGDNNRQFILSIRCRMDWHTECQIWERLCVFHSRHERVRSRGPPRRRLGLRCARRSVRRVPRRRAFGHGQLPWVPLLQWFQSGFWNLDNQQCFGCVRRVFEHKLTMGNLESEMPESNFQQKRQMVQYG